MKTSKEKGGLKGCLLVVVVVLILTDIGNPMYSDGSNPR